MPEESKRPGRPPIVPGEESIELSVSVELSLFRQLRRVAQVQCVGVGDVVRDALRREFFRKNLHDDSTPANV